MKFLLHALDISGAIFAFFSTVFYVKADKWAWPIGAIATALNIVLYGLTGIYGDMTLEGIYFLSMFYGWYQWTRGSLAIGELPISNLSWRLAVILSVLAAGGIWGVAELLKHFTNSQVPYLDAVTTVLSLIAQWMICKKIIQTWFLWFIVDAIYVGLYLYKGIPAHSILLVIYLGLAVAGYLRWQKLMGAEKEMASFKLSKGFNYD
ncbi:nicotinamide riboside transporter PnuC [Coxiella burnetii]|uniref:Nicotinamide riboside transporter PnuC n=2 Tax=Coxiella burnetii TaxID=777 RepID=Q83AZ7_COXBU|nr:nicotinamide riboside transporter PnuC [Coxiella burnetii]NP_820709.1 N-ribosylnicotinamide transporter [Coxiella burnetii RSA 493]AAO91223.1 nicotinamide mononucleotide transporter [Coxiella burnetii RSA 493]ABS78471.1 nicotinamide mononucleotide transporter [Coxiella burnetii Dugway 5J108-111]ABX78728.1 nicotinamide mononucleotide transporter family protein [Coxiella burnetii RSA 331]ACJ17562.1 nicotinamide mononucleotide transporter [Coxiella burnetii CbuG_Q212]AIT62615.1 Nicotinamide m